MEGMFTLKNCRVTANTLTPSKAVIKVCMNINMINNKYCNVICFSFSGCYNCRKTGHMARDCMYLRKLCT